MKKIRRSPKTASGIPADILVQYVASTFTLVLNWWMESGKPLPPGEVNALFRAMVEPTLSAALP